MAVKVLLKHSLSAEEITRAKREIQILLMLSHPNVVTIHDQIEDEHALYIFMECFRNGDMNNYCKEPLSEEESHFFFTQLVDAISYCHSANIVHRDIKLSNMMLTPEGNIKLIDFGLSNFTQTGKLHTTFCGSLGYAAPEMVCHRLSFS